MAGLDGQVVWLERATALLVDHIEGADDPDEVDEVAVVARAPASIEVADERRATDRREDEVRAPELEIALRVAGVEHEGRGGGPDERLGLGGVEPDTAGLAVDRRA